MENLRYIIQCVTKIIIIKIKKNPTVKGRYKSREIKLEAGGWGKALYIH